MFGLTITSSSSALLYHPYVQCCHCRPDDARHCYPLLSPIIIVLIATINNSQSRNVLGGFLHRHPTVVNIILVVAVVVIYFL